MLIFPKTHPILVAYIKLKTGEKKPKLCLHGNAQEPTFIS